MKILLFSMFIAANVCEEPPIVVRETQAITDAAKKTKIEDQFKKWILTYASSSPLRAQNKVSAFPNSDDQVLAHLDSKDRQKLPASAAMKKKSGEEIITIEVNSPAEAHRDTFILKEFIKYADAQLTKPEEATVAYVGGCHAYDFSIATQAKTTSQTMFVGMPMPEAPGMMMGSQTEALQAQHSSFANCLSSFPASPTLKTRVEQRWFKEKQIDNPSTFVFSDIHTIVERRQYDEFPAGYFNSKGIKKVRFLVEGFDHRNPMSVKKFRESISIEAVTADIEEIFKTKGKTLSAQERERLRQTCPEGLCSLSPTLGGLLDLAERIEKTGVEVEIVGIDTTEASVRNQIQKSMTNHIK